MPIFKVSLKNKNTRDWVFLYSKIQEELKFIKKHDAFSFQVVFYV